MKEKRSDPSLGQGWYVMGSLLINRRIFHRTKFIWLLPWFLTEKWYTSFLSSLMCLNRSLLWNGGIDKSCSFQGHLGKFRGWPNLYWNTLLLSFLCECHQFTNYPNQAASAINEDQAEKVLCQHSKGPDDFFLLERNQDKRFQWCWHLGWAFKDGYTFVHLETKVNLRCHSRW